MVNTSLIGILMEINNGKRHRMEVYLQEKREIALVIRAENRSVMKMNDEPIERSKERLYNKFGRCNAAKRLTASKLYKIIPS